MRTLAIIQNVSADGSAELLGDWFDPGDQGEDLVAEAHRQSETEEYMLLGRKTFTDLLNNVKKLVVSSTLDDPGWQNSTVLGADWRQRVRALKEEDGGDITVTGSLTLCQALFEEDLVDELRLFVFPVAQGEGRRLFPDGWQRRLELQESRVFASGVVLLIYRLGAGGQATGREG